MTVLIQQNFISAMIPIHFKLLFEKQTKYTKNKLILYYTANKITQTIKKTSPTLLHNLWFTLKKIIQIIRFCLAKPTHMEFHTLKNLY